jgi:hypothetical protein
MPAFARVCLCAVGLHCLDLTSRVQPCEPVLDTGWIPPSSRMCCEEATCHLKAMPVLTAARVLYVAEHAAAGAIIACAHSSGCSSNSCTVGMSCV